MLKGAHPNILLCTWDLKWIWWHTPYVNLEVEKMSKRNFRPTEKLIFPCLLSAWRMWSNVSSFLGSSDFASFFTMFDQIYFSSLIFPWCIVYGCRPVSPTQRRKLGKCPLTPEEAALVLSGLGFKRGTYIYLAGYHIYGGQSRMHPFTNLYPNLVTKEDLLSPGELEPFRNFSSQVN